MPVVFALFILFDAILLIICSVTLVFAVWMAGMSANLLAGLNDLELIGVRSDRI